MSLIQVVLFCGLGSAFLLYFLYFRQLLFDRLIAISFFGLAAFAVLVPEATSVVAHALGVGRGADLLLYLFAIGSLFVFLMLYSKIDRTQAALTEVVRYLAITHAKRPDPPGGTVRGTPEHPTAVDPS